MKPNFVKEIFYCSPNATQRKNNFVDSHLKQSILEKNLRLYRIHIWKPLPENLKSITLLHKFKDFMKNLQGTPCKCNLCKITAWCHSKSMVARNFQFLTPLTPLFVRLFYMHPSQTLLALVT